MTVLADDEFRDQGRSSDGWVPVDRAVLIPRAARAAIARAEGSLPGLRKRLAEAPAVIVEMMASMEGQPKAMNTTPGGSSEPPWCWRHSRSQSECKALGLGCLGESVFRAKDPTGEAGSVPDPASARLKEYVRLIVMLSKIEERLAKLAQLHPSTASERESLPSSTSGPGEGWCISCYRLDRRHEPIAMHRDGRKRYPLHCRWCGDIRADKALAFSGEPMDPSLEMLRAHHTPGETVTVDMVAEARKEHARVMRMRARHAKRVVVRRARRQSGHEPGLTSEDA